MVDATEPGINRIFRNQSEGFSFFSFSYTPLMQGFLYSNNGIATVNNAPVFSIVEYVGANYQLSPKAALTFLWEPEYDLMKKNALTETSNEMDLGVNFEVAKGWALNPYIGIQPNGMNTSSLGTMGKGMEAAMIVSGRSCNFF